MDHQKVVVDKVPATSQFLNANLKNKPKVVDDKVPATSQFLNANLNKPKVASGYDDLPKRDNSIGERQKKHEEDLGDYYKQVEKLRAAKSETYSRESAAPSLPEETLKGKQMENPKKIYRHKLQVAAKKCKGRVRSIKRLTGFYGGELSARRKATFCESIKFVRRR